MIRLARPLRFFSDARKPPAADRDDRRAAAGSIDGSGSATAAGVGLGLGLGRRCVGLGRGRRLGRRCVGVVDDPRVSIGRYSRYSRYVLLLGVDGVSHGVRDAPSHRVVVVFVVVGWSGRIDVVVVVIVVVGWSVLG